MTEMDKLHVEAIACGSYRANAWFVYREDRPDALLVDPGDDPVRCLEAIRASGKRLTDIALTHGHFDHTIGAYHIKSLTGAKIAMHSQDAEMLCDAGKALCGPKEGSDHFVPCKPDILFDELSEGLYAPCGIPFRVLHTPGHTPGGVCLYLPEQNLLFSGDTIFAYGFGRTDFEGGSLSDLKASLHALFALPAETAILPGHGDIGSMATYHAQLNRGRA